MGEDGVRSTKPSFNSKGIVIEWRKRTFLKRLISIPVSISWPFLSYYFVKTFFSRKTDFVGKDIPLSKEKVEKRLEINEEINQINIVKITKPCDENIHSNNPEALNGIDTQAAPNDLEEVPFDKVEAFQKFENL